MIPRQAWRQARPENQESRPKIQEFQSWVWFMEHKSRGKATRSEPIRHTASRR